MLNALKYPNPKPLVGGSVNMGPGKAAGENAQTQAHAHCLGGMCDWDCHGRVRTSRITLSGAGCCSRRGCAWAGSHSDTH